MKLEKMVYLSNWYVVSRFYLVGGSVYFSLYNNWYVFYFKLLYFIYFKKN